MCGCCFIIIRSIRCNDFSYLAEELFYTESYDNNEVSLSTSKLLRQNKHPLSRKLNRRIDLQIRKYCRHAEFTLPKSHLIRGDHIQFSFILIFTVYYHKTSSWAKYSYLYHSCFDQSNIHTRLLTHTKCPFTHVHLCSFHQSYYSLISIDIFTNIPNLSLT